MRIQVFVADSAAQAVARIRQELGPEAVVLQVRQQLGRSLARLWQRPRVEVVAGVPHQEPREAKVNELLQQITRLNQQLPSPPKVHEYSPDKLRPRCRQWR